MHRLNIIIRLSHAFTLLSPQLGEAAHTTEVAAHTTEVAVRGPEARGPEAQEELGESFLGARARHGGHGAGVSQHAHADAHVQCMCD